MGWNGKLNDQQLLDIYDRANGGESSGQLASEFGVGASHICVIKNLHSAPKRLKRLLRMRHVAIGLSPSFDSAEEPSGPPLPDIVRPIECDGTGTCPHCMLSMTEVSDWFIPAHPN